MIGRTTTVAIFACACLASSAQAQPSERIVGGGPTTINAHPHQVALVVDSRFPGYSDDFDRQFCGGALITPRIVQTAAHCIFDGDPDPGEEDTTLDTDDLDVVVGRTTLSGPGGQKLDVLGGVIDLGYDPVTAAFDAAWLVLGADAVAPAAPIKIAGPAETGLWGPGAQTQTSGWGDETEGGSGSDTLKAATVPIIADAACNALTGLYDDFDAETMVCAGFLAGGTDACQGDSGGPLVSPGTVRLVGVTSWGDGCAQPNAPSVYTRIAGPIYNPFVQQVVDAFEADFGLADAGSVYGTPPPVVNPPVAPPPKPKPKKKKKKKKKKRKKRK